MSDPPTITRTPTQIGGMAVLAVEPAYAPHPHPAQGGRLVPYKGVTKALLEDGSEVYLCEGDGKVPCPFSGDSTRSVVAHRNGTHNLRRPRPTTQYPQATLRRIATEVTRARRDGSRGHSARAAEALNAAGITTLSGRRWNAGLVSHVYNDHCRDIRVHLRETRPTAASQQAVGQVRAAVNGHVEHPGQIVPPTSDDLGLVRQWLALLIPVSQAIEQILERAERQGALDQDTIEKARRYDEMRSLLRPT